MAAGVGPLSSWSRSADWKALPGAGLVMVRGAGLVMVTGVGVSMVNLVAGDFGANVMHALCLKFRYQFQVLPKPLQFSLVVFQAKCLSHSLCKCR